MAESNTFPLVLAIREDTSVGSAMSSFEDSIRQSAARAGVHLDGFGRKYRGLRDELAKQVADPLGITAQLKNLNGSPFQRILNDQLAASTALAAQHARVAKAGDTVTTSVKGQAQAYVQASQQAQDFIVSIQGGINPLVAFAQQGSQLAFVMQGAGGKLGAFATLMSGFTGTAVLAAVALAGSFLPALLRSAAASDEAKKALEAHRKAMLDLAAAQNDALLTSAALQARTTAQLQLEYETALATRKSTQVLLEKAEAVARLNAEMARTPSGSSEEAIEKERQASGADQRLAEIRAVLAKNQSEERRLQSGFESAYARLVTMKVEARSTPQGAVQERFENALRAVRRDPAYRGTTNSDALAIKVDQLIDARDRELKAVNEAEAAQKKLTASVNEIGRTLSLSEAKGIVAGIGGTVTSDIRTRAEQEVLYARYGAGTGALAARPGHSAHELGQALDIRTTPGMSLEKIRDAFRSRGAQITELLDEGSHFHVAWKASAAASKEAGEAAREAASAQRELDQSLESIRSRFDPAAAAANDYADAIAEIAKLEAAGKIGRGTAFDLERKVDQAQAAEQVAKFNQAFRSTFGDGIGEAINEWQRGLTAGAIAASEELTGGVRGAVEQLRFAASGIADLLGIQIGGPYRQLLQSGGIEGQSRDIAEAVAKAIRNVGVKFDDISEARLANVIAAAGYGQIGTSIYSAISGRQGSGVAGAIGGILGNEGGKAVSAGIEKALGPGLGKVAGAAAGPLGSIVGGLIGSAVGGLFRTVKFATANVSQSGSTIAGNDSSARGAAGSLGDAVAQGVQRIVDQFGGTLGSYDLAIGSFDNKIRVSTKGTNESLNGKSSVARAGLVTDFGTDGADAAIRFAIADAIRDGAVQGLRAATQRLIEGGSDVEAQLQKALKFEAIFTSLRQIKDPVAAAAEAIDKEFANLRKIADEAMASSDERAQLEELYALRRTEAVKQAQESAAGQLKALLDDLRNGDNGLNLRTRQTNVLASLNPLIADIEAGRKVDQGQFTEQARVYLEIQRALYGSTSLYFDALTRVTDLTNRAIQNSGAGANVASLLSGNTQQAAMAAAAASSGSVPSTTTITATVDITGMVMAIATQTDALTSRLDLISRQLAQPGAPVVLQLGDAGGIARVNALRNA